MSRDPLSYLLDLDGEVLIQESGYWVKIEARVCAATPQVPHGVSYSLTLHDVHRDRALASPKAQGLLRAAGRVRSLASGWPND